MDLYPKINSIYKRDSKGKMLHGEYSCEEFKYLENNLWSWTSKVDGCFTSRTKVLMADGTKKTIGQIKEGDIVLGVKDGRPTSSAVVKTHDNGPADEWINVRYSRCGLGRSNSFSSIVCTPDHLFWDPVTMTYKPISSFDVGDTVLVHRSEYKLTPIQKSVLLGKLLGDGTFMKRPPQPGRGIEWGHTEEDVDYVNWTLSAIGDAGCPTLNKQTSGYGSTMWRGRTIFSIEIANCFSDYESTEGIKVIPESVVIDLDPIALAFWYMDDGTLTHHSSQEDRVRFSTCSFSLDEHKFLQQGLDKFGIHSTIAEYGGYLYLNLDTESSERLFLLVAPYVPPCMQRKLPEHYRGHAGWIPQTSDRHYRPTLVEQTITSITRNHSNTTTVGNKHDLTTETGNYFANGVLVHNCNIRVGLSILDDKYSVEYGGRTDNAQIPIPLLTKLRSTFESEEMEASVWDVWGNGNTVTLYGEGYGNRIQQGGGNYIPDGVDFILFDVKIGTFWLRPPDVEAVGRSLGIKTVPKHLPMTLLTAFFFVRNGWTDPQWPNVVPEGLVGRPEGELFNRKGERITVKIKGIDFKV